MAELLSREYLHILLLNLTAVYKFLSKAQSHSSGMAGPKSLPFISQHLQKPKRNAQHIPEISRNMVSVGMHRLAKDRLGQLS